MRKIVKTIILAALTPAILLSGYLRAAAADPVDDVAAKAALLIELDSGTVLYPVGKKDAIDSKKYDAVYTKLPADGLTRAMTLLLAVSACEDGTIAPDGTVEMTGSAYYNIDAEPTENNISPGEKVSFLDLMYCAFIGGLGEACNRIAELVSGSYSSFVSAMNTLAKEIGCLDTNFVNANGMYSARQLTTAMDQYMIFREAVKHPLFVEISGAGKYEAEIMASSELRSLVLYNSNELLNANSNYYYKACTSGTASATYEGRYSSVSLSEVNGLNLVCVILGAEDIGFEDGSVDLQNLSEARRLFEWGFANFSERTILSTTELVGKAPIMHGAGADFVNLRPESSIELLLDNSIPDSNFERVITIYSVKNNDVHYAPVYVGDVLGEVKVVGRDDGTEYGSVLLVAKSNVDLNRMQFIRMRISDMLASPLAKAIIWVIVVVVLGYAALVVRYNILRRKRLQRITEAKRKLAEDRRGNPAESRDDNIVH